MNFASNQPGTHGEAVFQIQKNGSTSHQVAALSETVVRSITKSMMVNVTPRSDTFWMICKFLWMNVGSQTIFQPFIVFSFFDKPTRASEQSKRAEQNIYWESIFCSLLALDFSYNPRLMR